MKNNEMMQQFHNREFGDLDILMIDDRPYFPATECAVILGYRNPHDAISKHCRYLAKREAPHPQNHTKRMFRNFIPEGDLYRLIARSKLPAAERFEKWVFDEVLPTIRKYGAYISTDTLDEMLRSRKCVDKLLSDLKKERDKYSTLEEENAMLAGLSEIYEELATEMAPKAIYCDMILQCKSTVPVSLIAKDYGMSAAEFNNLLHGFGIQYKTGGTWLLYQKYANHGYTQTRTYRVGERVAAVHTCWTQKGRLFLYEFLKQYGFLPLVEDQYDEPLPA